MTVTARSAFGRRSAANTIAHEAGVALARETNTGMCCNGICAGGVGMAVVRALGTLVDVDAGLVRANHCARGTFVTGVRSLRGDVAIGALAAAGRVALVLASELTQLCTGEIVEEPAPCHLSTMLVVRMARLSSSP